MRNSSVVSNASSESLQFNIQIVALSLVLLTSLLVLAYLKCCQGGLSGSSERNERHSDNIQDQGSQLLITQEQNQSKLESPCQQPNLSPDNKGLYNQPWGSESLPVVHGNKEGGTPNSGATDLSVARFKESSNGDGSPSPAIPSYPG